jgi:predicted RNA methylase
VEVYDAWADQLDLDTEGAVEVLAALAGAGPVLELAIGTGRLALPLSERGLEVHGIDGSPEMVAKLLAKPGGERIPVTIGDMADVETEYTGPYSLIFVVFNTLFGLDGREQQARMFAKVAARLTDDGVFVVEGSIPDLERFERDDHVTVRRVDFEAVTVVETSRHEPAAQRVETEHILMRADGVSTTSFTLSYLLPDQLDAMAHEAGLRLRERHRDWRRRERRSEIDEFVAVYERDR